MREKKLIKYSKHLTYIRNHWKVPGRGNSRFCHARILRSEEGNGTLLPQIGEGGSPRFGLALGVSIFHIEVMTLEQGVVVVYKVNCIGYGTGYDHTLTVLVRTVHIREVSDGDVSGRHAAKHKASHDECINRDRGRGTGTGDTEHSCFWILHHFWE